MKKFLSFLLITVLFSTIMISTVSADSDIELYFNDQYVESDAPPFVYYNRTMVPLRLISELTGYEVEWEPTNKGIFIRDPWTYEIVMLLFIDSETAYTFFYSEDGEEHFLDVPPLISDGRTYVPLRFIAETLGLEVAFDGSIPAVYLYTLEYFYSD